MTETQAQSGTAGAPANPVDGEDAGTPKADAAAVGRATVPADGAAPKFTRAPGMAPPPDRPAAAGTTQSAGDGGSAASTSPAAGSAGLTAVDSGGTRGRPGDRPSGPSQAAPGTRPAARTAAGPGQPAPGGGAATLGAVRVSEAVRAARTAVSSAASRGPRRARLHIKRVDPWSVMKFSFAVSLVLFIVVIVATSVLYLALDAMGVFKSVNGTLTDLVSTGADGSGGFRITAKGVIGASGLLGLINVVLFTALATLGAFVYNVCADLVGGIELTLAERD